jgi:hypothetical protein
MFDLLKTLSKMGATALPDTDGWQNRFQIRSSSSDRVYVVAQSRANGHWSCSCPASIYAKGGRRGACKHLRALGVSETAPAPAPAPAPTPLPPAPVPAPQRPAAERTPLRVVSSQQIERTPPRVTPRLVDL